MSEDKKLNENLETEKTETTETDPSMLKTAEELGAMDVDQLMEQYDLETSKLRKLTGKVALFITIVAILMSAFHLYTAWHGTLLAMKQRSLHLIFAFTLGFALYPGFKNHLKIK